MRIEPLTQQQQPPPQMQTQGQTLQEPLLDLLTKRERRVATLVALAQTDKQIAKSLFITVRTVRAHIDVIKQKLNLDTKMEVCRWMLVTHYEQNIDIYDNVL